MDNLTIPAAPSPADDPYSAENIARRQALQIAERDAQGRLLPGSVLPGAGRKPDGVSIMALARVHTSAALKLLAEVVNDPKAPTAARVTAAQALIDRGWGKAPVQIDVQMRSRFDDFLRDVGITARYRYEHPEVVEAVVAAAFEDESPKEGEIDDTDVETAGDCDA